MKFVIASHSERLAGAERSLYAIVAAAVDAGHQVLVTIPRQGPLQEKLLAFPDVEVITLPTHAWMHGSRFDAKVIPRTLASISDSIHHLHTYRKFNPDFVVVNSTVIPGPMVAAWLCRIPTIVMVRESIQSNSELYSIIPKRALIKMIERLSSIRFAVSSFVALQFNRNCIIDYPDVRRDLNISAVQHVHDKSDDSLPRKALRAVMLGSYSPEKGQKDAMRAVAIARAAGANIQLSLYGYAHEHELSEIEKWCKDNDMSEWIRHRGFIDEPQFAYGEADVSLVCSKNEAYGRVTAESLLSGVPVVGYRLGGTTEILSSGGGVACTPTPEALAAALVRLFEEPDALQDLRSQCKSLAQVGDVFGDSTRTVSLMAESVASLMAD
jgi:glycosyltransferase involved in cell wall biosynthesis